MEYDNKINTKIVLDNGLTYQTLISQWSDIKILAKNSKDSVGRNITSFILNNRTYSCEQINLLD